MKMKSLPSVNLPLVVEGAISQPEDLVYLEKIKQQWDLKTSLPLPLNKDESEGGENFYLVWDDNKRRLFLKRPSFRPVAFDFFEEWKNFMRQRDFLWREPLAKALGAKRNHPKKILDATCGRGKDALFMLALGLEVEAHERSPLIYLLLQDALRQVEFLPSLILRQQNYQERDKDLKLLEQLQKAISDRFRLSFEESQLFLQNDPSLREKESRPQVIYLDPMYPPKKKSAKSCKEMEFFHQLIGGDEDAEKLFTEALDQKWALERVVIKRPLGAPPWRRPSVQYQGRSTRYDMYLIS